MTRHAAVVLAAIGLACCSRAPRNAAANGAGRSEQPARKAGQIRFAPDSPQLSQIRCAKLGLAEVAVDQVVAPGKIAINPNRVSRVVLPVAGRIAAVEVQLGDAVTQGQPLLRIESPEAEAAMSDCFRTDAARAQAKAALVKAEADLSRVTDLFRHDAAARKQVLDAEAEVARNGAALQDVEAAREQARRRLSILGLKACQFGQQVVVSAAISGKVMELNVVPGEYRNDTNANLLTIADLSSVWVASQVPESAIRWIQKGERVRIEIAAFPGEVFTGKVMRVADTLDPQTRTVEVQTELRNPAGRFRPEMFAKIRHAHGSRLLPVLPARALVRTDAGDFVFRRAAPGEFERVRVETGEPVAAGVPVLSGLERGDSVVVEGAMLLQAPGGEN